MPLDLALDLVAVGRATAQRLTVERIPFDMDRPFPKRRTSHGQRCREGLPLNKRTRIFPRKTQPLVSHHKSSLAFGHHECQSSLTRLRHSTLSVIGLISCKPFSLETYAESLKALPTRLEVDNQFCRVGLFGSPWCGCAFVHACFYGSLFVCARFVCVLCACCALRVALALLALFCFALLASRCVESRRFSLLASLAGWLAGCVRLFACLSVWLAGCLSVELLCLKCVFVYWFCLFACSLGCLLVWW